MLTFVNLRGSSRQRKSGKYTVFLPTSVFRRCSWIRLRADSVSGMKRRSTCAEAQLQYAARDAAVLIPLREKLIEKIKSLGLIQCAQLEFECVMPVAFSHCICQSWLK